MKYIVVYEQTPNNWGAYVPDLPGCVATGKTREKVRRLIKEGIGYHIEITQEYNELVPQPGTWAEEIEVDVPVRDGTGSGEPKTLVQFVVVYEQGPTSWGASVPDLPGCVAAADTRDEVRQLIKEAIEFHLEGMHEDNDPIPPPGYWAEALEVKVSDPQTVRSE